MHLILVRIIPVVTLGFLIGAQCTVSVAAEKAATQAGKGESARGAASRALNAKQVVQEEDLDHLTVAGEAASDICESCEPSDATPQERAAVPVPGLAGSSTSFMIQEELRAAGARIPAPINQNQFIGLPR